MNFNIKYLSPVLFVAISFLLPRESQSRPVKTGGGILVTNVLLDTNLWHESSPDEDLMAYKNKMPYKNIVDHFNKGSFFIRDEKISKDELENNNKFFVKNKSLDKSYSDSDGLSCIRCTDVTVPDFRSFAQASSVLFPELEMSNEYSIFGMINSVYPVSFMGAQRLEIGLFETLIMVGFGVLMGIFKHLRLSHLAPLEVHNRNGEIVGAPMAPGLGAGRPRKAAHRTPLFIRRMPVPGL